MAVNPVNWALSHLTLVVTGVLALVLIAWAYDSYREAETKRDALEGFGSRAAKGTGGVLNVVLVTLVALVGAAAQVAGSLGDLVAYVAGLIPHGPVIASAVGSIGLGGLALSEWLTLHPLQYVGITGVVLIVAVAWRADL
jgi:hypothetical protein